MGFKMKSQQNVNAVKIEAAEQFLAGGYQTEAIATLAECLEAVVHVRGVGPVPDYGTRLKAAEKILSYTDGLPPRRFEILQAKIDASKVADAQEDMEMNDSHLAAMEEACRAYKLSKLENKRGLK